MRNKAPLVLMEQIVMVLVFALAAALCIQTFALSNRLSGTGSARDRALILAQSAAEICKNSRFDTDELISRLGGQVSQGLYYVDYGSDWTEPAEGDSYTYRLCVQGMPSGIPGLGQAEVWVTAKASAGDQTLTRLTVAWQEVGGHE